jgi:5-methylcytosine-specific restriction endonuclease McrA
VVHRVKPFVIRLRDRREEHSALQPVTLKIDPGSRTTGMALARIETTPEGEVQHALFLSEVRHRGEEVHEAKNKQAAARRRRRSVNLRHRAPRFLNRRRLPGWLPPSIRSRVDNVVSWTARFCRFAPVIRLEVEQVRFDLQLIQNPEITGMEYQHGELAGWELRTYLLIKYDYTCAYCGKQGVPFELDHQVPRSRGGSNRTSNLVLACHACNAAKGDQTAIEFGHPEVAAGAKVPLKDAAAVNTTRYRLVEELRCFGVPIRTWSGGRTRWNRERFGLEKAHALDALAVGDLIGAKLGKLTTLQIRATGRGRHCRTLWNRYGFPRAYLPRRKMVAGLRTGDRVKAVVPASLRTAGVHVGRVAVRTTGSCAVRTSSGTVDGINVRYLRLVQRGDGYEYL